MATLTVSFTPTATAPANGYVVRYRIKGSGGAYTTVNPNPTASPVIILGLLAATEYEGDIGADCGYGFSTVATFSTCTCAVGFARSVQGEFCEKTETTAPTITNSGYCLAISNNTAYAHRFSRIYNTGFSNATIEEFIPSNPGDVYAELSSSPQWAGSLVTNGLGPMNRAGVWIDSDCNGTKNSLIAGQQTTVAYAYDNNGLSRTVYVGIGGDNQFILKVNGVQVAASAADTNPEHFKIWHIFPVTINVGWNDFNVVATGDGTPDDAVGMVIYDNTNAQIAAAASDGDLNILFTSASLRGGTYDVATCPATYSLDTSGGSGNYICRRITTQPCGGA